MKNLSIRVSSFGNNIFWSKNPRMIMLLRVEMGLEIIKVKLRTSLIA